MAGSSVALAFRDNDGVALNTIMAGDTTGAFDNELQRILLQQRIFMLEG